MTLLRILSVEIHEANCDFDVFWYNTPGFRGKRPTILFCDRSKPIERKSNIMQCYRRDDTFGGMGRGLSRRKKQSLPSFPNHLIHLTQPNP